ncbi:MAG TPA: hypothetical protein VNQ56_08395 [Pseudolabrys sp.]|nr:hypothetical protein [Pseudolabrys sp.]
MRGFIIIAIAIGAVWIVDRLALQSRYSNAVFREAQYQAQLFNIEIEHWLRRLK